MSDSLQPPPPAHDQGKGDKGPLLAAVVAALLGALLYAVTLGGTFIFDDVYHLFDDDRSRLAEPPPGWTGPRFEKPVIEDPGRWHLYLTQGYNDGVDNLYRPVTSLSYAAQATLHGRGDGVAWAWHLFNVLLYAVVCGQVALLAGRLVRAGEGEDRDLRFAQIRREGGSARSSDFQSLPSTFSGYIGGQRLKVAATVALGAGVLFAAHPVHVEVVAGIVGRAELICAAGFLGALLVITRPITPGRILAFVALMLLAIGGKEQGLVLPLVALAWFLARRRAGLPSLLHWPPPAEARAAEVLEAPDGAIEYETKRPRDRGDDLAKLFFIAVALPLAGYLLLREQVLELSMAWPKNLVDPTIQPMRDAAGLDRWLMPVALAGRYLHLLLWPHRLAIDYGAVVIAPPQRWDDPYLWLGVLAIALFIAAAVHAWRARWAAGLTVLAGFAVTYGVVSNIPTLIGTVFGERLMFLPSAFFVMYLVLLAQRLRPGRRWWVVAAIVLAGLGAVRSLTYAQRWNDRLAFYQYQSQVQSKSIRTWMLLAEELRQQGRLEEAAAAAVPASELDPDYWDGWVIRARVALERGRLEEALEYAERAVAARTSYTTTSLLTQIEQRIREREAANPATRPTTQGSDPRERP